MTIEETLKTLEFDLSSVETVKNAVSKVLADDGFNSLNNILQVNNKPSNKFDLKLSGVEGNLEFISVNKDFAAPYSKILSEKEFFKIVGLTKNGLSKRSGKYQESLFSNYLEAKDEQDNGYINDIFNKAVVFQNNLNYVKALMKKPSFMIIRLFSETLKQRRNCLKDSTVF